MTINKIEDLQSTLPEIEGSYRFNADLSKTNWFGVGGPADVLFRPKNINDLSNFLKNKPHNLPVTVLGVGSNLLVRDGGIEGVVIKLGRGFTEISSNGMTITSGAGNLCYNVAMFTASRGISGIEFLSGIPGSIGGALAMNAGAYGGDIASCIVEAKAVDEMGEIHTLKPEDIGYVYRGNTLPEGMIFVEGTFIGKKGAPSEIENKINEITSARQETQPIKSKTSGSTFKNPSDNKAWKLIDEAGCRGLKIGGAQVSEKHCNFFINTGNASASDIENLILEVQKRVKENSGIKLVSEVKIVGRKNHKD